MQHSKTILVLTFIVCTLLSSGLWSQNVGIGNPTPSEKLDVAGNVKADTLKSNAVRIAPNAGSGKVLTSDASGNGNWEELALESDGENGNVGYGVWGDCETNGNISGYQPVADTAASANALFGASVACNGEYAVVGAPSDDLTHTNQGSASIYHFNGTSWDFIQKISDPDPSIAANFGHYVALSGNFIFVGSPQDDITSNNQGSVSVFQLTGMTWEFLEKLSDPEPEASEYYGISVAIDGNRAIVGAYADDINVFDQGSAFIYHFNGVNWILQQKVYDQYAGNLDFFGGSVSISEDRVAIGCAYDDEGLEDQGSVSIYHFDGTNWILKQKVLDPIPSTTDYLGWSVSVSGNEIVAGAAEDDDFGINAGKVLTFKYNGSSWVFTSTIYNPEITSSNHFGNSTSLSDGIVLIGSYLDFTSLFGSASLFQKVGLFYQELQYIIDPAAKINDHMGTSVCIDSESRHFIIGVPNYGNGSGKALFGRIR